MSTDQLSLLEQVVEDLVVPPAPPGRESEADRFWSKVEIRGDLECWPWIAVRLPKGYGVFSTMVGPPGARKEKKVYAHRWVFEAFFGEISLDMTVDHLGCDQPWCCNPLHVVEATRTENSMRGGGASAVNARKTECIHGHPFTPENTRISPKGHRVCRECVKEDSRRRRRRRSLAKKKEEAHSDE